MKNIEKTLKAVALSTRTIGITCSITLGAIFIFLGLLSNSGIAFLVAVIITPIYILTSIILSFFLSWLIYGFGELIETQKEILRVTKESIKYRI